MRAKNESYFQDRENRKLLMLFYLFLGLSALGLGFVFRFYFWPFLFAIIFYMALRSVFERLVELVKFRGVAALLMISLIVLVILIPVFMLLVSMADQAFELYRFIQHRYTPEILNQWIMKAPVLGIIDNTFHIGRGELVAKGVEFLKTASLGVFSNLTGVVTFSMVFFLDFFFMLLIMFFLFKDAYRFEGNFYAIMPFPDDIEKDVVDRLREVIKILLAGNLFIMTLQGMMVGIGLSIAGFRAPLLWGSIAAILSLIPVIGTSIVWLPGVVYLMLTGRFLMALFVGLWCMIWYLLLENLLKPNVFGKKLNFHPLVFFFLLLGSLQSFGLPGVVIGPMLLTLFYSLWEIYRMLNSYSPPPPPDEEE
jgi:predicted PurR-regulated permease PerM